MTRVLVIPAAGRGSRLGWQGPKALCPVGGRPMVDWLFDRYAPVIDLFVIVASPLAAPEFRRRVAHGGVAAEVAVQETPTGMLPAVLCARPFILQHQPNQVWVTWCDQVGISALTVDRLAGELDRHADAALVLPTVRQAPPYIHFVRDAGGRIVKVLHRREGDDMPETGESDAGLFGLRRDAYLTDLPAYERAALVGDATRERNFLPFIPWLAARNTVRTFDLPDPREAVGVNTPDDLALMETYLRERA